MPAHIHESGPMPVRIGRRAFLLQGSLVLAASPHQSCWAIREQQPALTAALVTDMHYADKPPAGTRHYRETLGKLREARDQFSKEQPSFIIELGDFIDAADSVETEQKYLDVINREFKQICDERFYVLGNHCVDTLTKREFLDGVGQETSYFSFDRQGFHVVVLDACYRTDGQPYGRKNFTWTDTNIPQSELNWLEQDLRKSDLPTIVFVHQRLDTAGNHGIKNAGMVRDILERSGKVRAVFQGHSHKNDLKEIGGIHYCTLVAMVEGAGAENNGYSMLDLHSDGSLELRGFRKQASREISGK